ncbi:MAG: ChbG/HpnK family deacetylase [Zoogloeaceae bacterium]|nr:ChbG/HpnK family deacetylase [Zoogloeaceae bacterium]
MKAGVEQGNPGRLVVERYHHREGRDGGVPVDRHDAGPEGKERAFYRSAKSVEDQFATSVVCADDFGLAPGVNAAIAELIAAGRLSATSCMVAWPDWRGGVAMLKAAVAAFPADVGLHLTLTDQPALGGSSVLAPDGRFPRLAVMLRRGLARQLPVDEVRSEIRAQLDAFEDGWGGPPDYVDGHQHMHLLPTVRDALLDELVRRYPPGQVYARDCQERLVTILRRRVAVPKALFLNALGAGFARRARRAGVPLNQGFAGLHDFSGRHPFGELMRAFLRDPGLQPLIHVHPGRVDDVLRRRDGLTAPREVEFAYLASPQFLADVAAAGTRIAPFPRRERAF